MTRQLLFPIIHISNIVSLLTRWCVPSCYSYCPTTFATVQWRPSLRRMRRDMTRRLPRSLRTKVRIVLVLVERYLLNIYKAATAALYKNHPQQASEPTSNYPLDANNKLSSAGEPLRLKATRFNLITLTSRSYRGGDFTQICRS